MGYHNAEVRNLGHTYQAICACGWKGHARSLRRAAEQDAVAHDTAENERQR